MLRICSRFQTQILFSIFVHYSGIAASFAVKLFKAWMAEKDANSVTSALRKANLDKKLLVCCMHVCESLLFL